MIDEICELTSMWIGVVVWNICASDNPGLLIRGVILHVVSFLNRKLRVLILVQNLVKMIG